MRLTRRRVPRVKQTTQQEGAAVTGSNKRYSVNFGMRLLQRPRNAETDSGDAIVGGDGVALGGLEKIKQEDPVSTVNPAAPTVSRRAARCPLGHVSEQVR